MVFSHDPVEMKNSQTHVFVVAVLTYQIHRMIDFSLNEAIIAESFGKTMHQNIFVIRNVLAVQ